MKNTMMESNPLNFGKLFAEDSISLTLEQVNLAAEMSQSLASRPRQQWQVYLNSLAKFGTIEWLRMRSPELIQNDSIELSNPSVNQVQVGNFRFNLIVTDSSMNSEVCVPRVFLEDSINLSQLYLLVEVIEDLPVVEDSEEQVNVSVLGYLTQAQLNQQSPIVIDDELALFSTDWFELKPDKLLLYLRFFEPEIISNQQSESSNQLSRAAYQNRLSQTSQPTLNVGKWLKNQLDQLAEELSWALLPSLSYSSEFRELRSQIELFSDAVTELKNQAQLVIPFEARTAYKELICGEIPMRLYATIWQIDTEYKLPRMGVITFARRSTQFKFTCRNPTHRSR